MNARLGLALAGLLVLGGLACDAQKAEPEAPDEKTGARREEPLASPPARDLATLQSELAKQEAELRRLGVLSEGDGEAAKAEAAEAEPDEAAATEKGDMPVGRGGAEATIETKATDKGKNGSKKAEKKKSTKATGGSKDAKQTAPGSAPRPSKDAGDALAPNTTLDEDIGGMPEPEAAKAVQAPPRDRSDEQQQLRAEDRCPLICSLAENTCELAEEICSLAELHGDDSDYSVACERASNDCKQAEEACLECHG